MIMIKRGQCHTRYGNLCILKLLLIDGIPQLVEFLENTQPGLRLCLHQRDFKVGKTIVENIVSAIDTSRKVVIVLTKSYVNRQRILEKNYFSLLSCLFFATGDFMKMVPTATCALRDR